MWKIKEDKDGEVFCIIATSQSRPVQDVNKYKLINLLLVVQEVTAAEDVTFDMSAVKGVTLGRATYLAQDLARETVIGVFRRHGAACISTPLLMPRAKLYDTTESCVRLMTHSGGVVHAPHDLRVPFARYVATNGISNCKRYAVDRVYRERKVSRYWLMCAWFYF